MREGELPADDAGGVTINSDDAGRAPARRVSFEPSGDLSDGSLAALHDLDGRALGIALTSLVGEAAAFATPRRTLAEVAIDRAFAAGSASSMFVELDVPGLVNAYREVMDDPARRDVVDLIVRLLSSVDRDAILASIPMDATGLDLRARLLDDLDAATGAGATGATPNIRGIDFDSLGWHDRRAMAAPDDMASPAGPPDAPDDGGAHLASADGAPSSGAPSTGPGPTPGTYRAYGLLACDEVVLVGRPFALEVGLSRTPAAGVSGPPLELPRPERTEYMLDVQLFADGFDVGPDESWRHRLTVSLGNLHPTVVVHLTPRDMPDQMADRKISATFTIEGETHGVAERYIRVTKDEAELAAGDATAPTASGANITAPSGEPKAHVTITIRKGVNEGTLLWGVESDLPGVDLQHDHPATSDVGDGPQAFTRKIIQTLYVQGSSPGLFQLLQGIGKSIRNEMPVEVRAAIQAAARAAKPEKLQILLLTEEPYIPWELAWVDDPFEPGAPNYLGAQADIGRWVLDPAIPTDPRRVVRATSMAVVWGVYAGGGLRRLEAAEEEARVLREQYMATSIDAQRQPVTSLLDGTPPADIIHFAVHGKYDPEGPGDGIYLVSGPPIDPWQIVGSNLAGRAPFVFLNACQVGSAGTMLGNYSGIARAFLEAGASAVVAPLWSIDDGIARDIALGFYGDALRQEAEPAGDEEGGEKPLVAELLRRARSGLADHADERSATYLAYQFYGHPSLRLSWAPASASGGTANG